MDQDKPGKGKVRRKHGQLFLFLRDAGIALAAVVLILVAMFAYTGLWPPLVVVESDSMMHGPDNISHIGTIDTGDLVLVKKVQSVSGVATYMGSKATGHKTYGDYGDVVIYHWLGSSSRTPIIHRALIYLQLNEDGRSYQSEDLRAAPGGSWTPTNTSNDWSDLTGDFYLRNVGYNDQSVLIPISLMLNNMNPGSGFVTKGDHNADTDLSWSGYQPVRLEWVVGKARGEIPWFGLLKLWSSGTLKTPAPENSVRDLWITIGIIVVSPIVVDVFLTFRERRATARRRALEGAEPKEAPPPKDGDGPKEESDQK